MRRREFITLLGGAAWPVAARAQSADRIARIGFFGADQSVSASSTAYQAFLDELQIHGFKDGQNLIVAGDPPRDPCNVFGARLCRSWRAHELRS
jgi:putative ABC transport system substrate-binding protein